MLQQIEIKTKALDKSRRKFKNDHEFFRIEMQRKDQAIDSLQQHFNQTLNLTVNKMNNISASVENRTKILDLVAYLKLELGYVKNFGCDLETFSGRKTNLPM